MTTEHTDINIGYSGGAWSLGPRADADPVTQFDNNEVVLYAGAPSLKQRPGGTEFDFIGVNAGQDFYLLPQGQDVDVLYLGFASYDVSTTGVDRYNAGAESKGRVGTSSTRWVKSSLTDVNHFNPDGSAGNGEFSLWQTGSFGGANVFMSSFNDGVANANGSGLDVTDGISADDALWIQAGGHLHYNFGFTKPGRYEVDMRVSAYFGDDSLATPNTAGFSQSQDMRIYFSVVSVGQLQLDSSTYSVNEGAGTASIDVVRVGGSDGRIAVNYATSNGTATTGSDYTGASGTLEFLDGETRRTITIPILEDVLVEGNETFNVVLSSPGPVNLNEYIQDVEGDANGLIGAIGSAVVTIIDNDIPPTISDVANRSTPEDVLTGAIAFTVGDDTTPAGSLLVTATSSNTTLVPNASIVLGGSGANRTATITPALNQFGTTTITLTVTDASGLTATDTFDLTVTSVNDLPTITDVANQSIDQNASTNALAFTVGDVETTASSLTVSATSSNTTLIPNANIVIGGSGANRTVTVTPAVNQAGSATITLTVTDGNGESSSDTFIVNVNSVNSAPIISDVANQTTDEDTATGAIAFTVGDAETAAGLLVVTATSSNTTLVPNGNIVLAGSGANRTVTITPAANQSGSTTITLTVTDAGGLTATDTFVLNVASVNDLPTISAVSDQSTQAGVSIGPINFTIGDVETAAAALSVTAGSSNTTLLPLSGIVIAGSGANRNVTLTPAVGQTGSATVTLTVTDADGGSRNDTFELTVSSNSAPTISSIADRFVMEDASTGAIAFIVGDAETAAADLAVSATSSNTTVVPNANIVLGGSGANRTLTITPAAGQVGSTTITVNVTDAGGLHASDTFVLTVGDRVRATFDRSAGLTSATQPIDVRLVDIDNDGDLDVLFTEYNRSISILPNQGNVTFGAEVSLSALTVSDIHVADINGDNLPDIVSSVYTDDTYAETAIAVWRNLGEGDFSPQEIIQSTRNTAFIALTGVGDVNGDGLNDLVLSVDGASYVRNLGGGTFGPVTSIITGGINWESALQDVDQDGDLDVLRAIDDNGVFRLQLLRNLGASTPVFGVEELASFGANSVRNLAIADTNQDGFADIHFTRRSAAGRDIIAMQGTSTGTFEAPIVLGSGLNLTDLEIGDIDGDGRPDLALTAREQNQVHFAQNLGNGIFTDLQQFTHDGSSLNPYPEAIAIGDIDRDGRSDLVFSERFGHRIAWSRNRQGENITALTPPESGSYLNGYPMTFDVFLGFSVNLDTSGGSPTLPVTIGSQTIQVPFIGQPNTNTLRFRHLVQSTDLDIDGIQVANSVVLNGATITDIHDRTIDPAFLQFAAVDTTGILVNGGAPYVTGIMRLDVTPAATSSVRYAVTFSESVTGVTMDDFALDASGPIGAAITSVTGSGSSYVVTADIGSGDGTLKLRVLDDDSIVDTNLHPLGGVGVGSGEFAFGQGYTIRSSTATPVFNNVITDGHLDVSLLLYEGTWYPYWNGVGFWDTTDTVISAGPDAQATRPVDAKWEFLGAAAGEIVWIFPETYSETTPWPGVGAYDNSVDTFASYFESDPRINATAPWLTMQLLDVRGPEGGEFSLYQSGVTDPVVFMATADGITSEDTAWIPNLDHIHYNWAFTKPGLYQVDVIASGYVDFNQTGTYEPGVDPLSESQIITLHFAVELSAQNDAFTVTGREALHGSVTLNDQSEWGITATTTVESTTTKGTLSLQPNGSFTYQPSATFDGSDSFTYRLTNPNGGFTTATVTITGSTRPDFETVIRSGHTDIGVNFEDDAWDLHVHQHEPDTEYEPNEALFYVGRDAMQTRSGDAANAAYDFLGAPVGSTLFVLPEVENANLPFLGIGAEELADDLLEGDVASLRLASVSGPGHFSIWQSGLTPTTPNLIMATSDGIDASDVYEVVAGSHAHMNFAFTEQGLYEVTFVASGIDADGNATDSGQVTYYFHVTNGLVPFSYVRTVDSALGTVPNVQNSIAGDFDGDGDEDLVVMNNVALSWYRNTGGVLSAPITIPTAVYSGSGGLGIGDADGDGRDEIYVSPSSGTGNLVSLRWSSGDSFTESLIATGSGYSGRSPIIGDFNGDGKPDLLIRNTSRNIHMFAGNGDGTFGAAITIEADGGSTVLQILGADLNNDGHLDLVLAGNALKWRANDGLGGFAPAQTIANTSYSQFFVDDVTGDGLVDVVGRASGRFDVFRNQGDGSFAASQSSSVPSGVFPQVARLSDVDGDGDKDIVAGVFPANVLWMSNDGTGAFAAPISMASVTGTPGILTPVDLDNDGDEEIVYSIPAVQDLLVLYNRRTESANEVVAPTSGLYLAGQPIDVVVHIGYPVQVTGVPQIDLQVGSQTRTANYIAGNGSTQLTFRYIVSGDDLDTNGIELLSSSIRLNGGTILAHTGQPADLSTPAVDLSGVLVNGTLPVVSSIQRGTPATPNPTDAASVQFVVNFNKSVTGVDITDFAVTGSGTLSGASVASVSGSGNSYQVTVNTGTGSGVISLSVLNNGSIVDANGGVLGQTTADSQVFTIRRHQTPANQAVYPDGHGDVRIKLNDGQLGIAVRDDGFFGRRPVTEYDTEDVMIYGKAGYYLDGNGNAQYSAWLDRPTGSQWSFIGGTEQKVYLWPNDFSNFDVPYLGTDAGSIPAGTFAKYDHEDPRTNGIAAWLTMNVVGFRSDSGGHMSVYNVSAFGEPTVLFASSDGIDASDKIFYTEGSHAHPSWAFTRTGRYEVDVYVSGFRDMNGNGSFEPGIDVYTESGVQTLYFGIDFPQAVDDAFEVGAGGVLHGSVLLNDRPDESLFSGDVDVVSATVATAPTRGSLSLQPNGSFTYQPSATFNGSDSFTYRLSNPRGGFTTATVTITGSTRPDFAAVLTSGHTDIGVNFKDGAWDLHIHDEENEAEFEPDEALLYVGSDARVIRPSDSAYDFLGAPAGSAVFVLPEIENTELLYLGIGGEELGEDLLEGDVATLRLASVSGPGHFSIWQAGLTPTTPKLVMATADGINASDVFEVAAGSHAHANFAFTKIGFYEVTFVASGIDADGNATDSGLVTYYFQVGNTVEGLNVQNGQTQRSFVRNVDLVFGEEDSLSDLLAAGRVQVTRFDLNGNNGVALAGSAFSASVAGDRLRLDFGAQGIGGNRNTNAGDGYYRIGVDIDGDGTADVFKHFYRLLGDMNGDGKVDSVDRMAVMSAMRAPTPEADVNGDGVVNSADLTLVTRAIGKKLKDGLSVDD